MTKVLVLCQVSQDEMLGFESLCCCYKVVEDCDIHNVMEINQIGDFYLLSSQFDHLPQNLYSLIQRSD